MIWAYTLIFGIFFFRDETFASLTIPTIIAGGINMTFELSPNFLHALHVFWIGSTDVICVFHIKTGNEFLEFFSIIVNIFLRIETKRFSFFLDFITMLIGTSLKTHRVTQKFLVTFINIGKQIIFGMSNMWEAINIWYSGGNIDIFHNFLIIIAKIKYFLKSKKRPGSLF